MKSARVVRGGRAPTLSVLSNGSTAGPKMARWSGVMKSARVVRGGRALGFGGGRDGGGGGEGKRGAFLIVFMGGDWLLGSSLMGCLLTGSDLMFD